MQSPLDTGFIPPDGCHGLELGNLSFINIYSWLLFDMIWHRFIELFTAKEKYLCDLCAGRDSNLERDGHRGLFLEAPELGNQHPAKHEPASH